MSNRVKSDTPTEQKLHPSGAAGIGERSVMKACRLCGQPMLNASPVCGRCQPPTEGVSQMEEILDGPRKGHNGTYEADGGDMTDFVDENPAQVMQSFAYW